MRIAGRMKRSISRQWGTIPAGVGGEARWLVVHLISRVYRLTVSPMNVLLERTNELNASPAHLKLKNRHPVSG